ncbi:JAB domain-containing protein [Pseudomonas sp.]|uniref:JAB domain-containing protein n=1 Tax=Pseudomonas sp. TaxID=306 RepID=UPI0028ADA525|nr:JAB domain-containing protein [Pseudomonas sp.]
MRFHKLKAAEPGGSYHVESPVTESDILLMARQLAACRFRKGRALTDPTCVGEYLQVLLQDYHHEVFGLLLLDSKHRVIRFEEMFRGSIDAAHVYTREIVKIALASNAAAVILVHNHPSGDPTPSSADIRLTHTLKDALALVATRTLDHVIVGHEGCVSLAELGHL